MTNIARAAFILALLPAAAAAQRPLAERLGGSQTRTVAFSARSRPDVCGDGLTSYNDGLGSSRTRYYDGAMLLTHAPWDTRIPPCEKGPVRVTMRIVEGMPSSLRVAVGPLAALGDTVTDLGMVSDAQANAYLQQLMQGASGRVALEALMPLMLLDSTPRWEILASAARDTAHLLRFRRRASDLLARAAAYTLGPEANVEDDDPSGRREAVYALARQHEPNSDVVPELLAIAQKNPHRDARVAALYQLGQNGDPRALALFTAMLRGRP